MCLAIPARIESFPAESMARVRVGDGDVLMDVCTMLLPEEPAPGDYVIVHAGFALHSLTPEQARESLELLREMAEGIGSFTEETGEAAAGR